MPDMDLDVPLRPWLYPLHAMINLVSTSTPSQGHELPLVRITG